MSPNSRYTQSNRLFFFFREGGRERGKRRESGRGKGEGRKAGWREGQGERVRVGERE